jgi:hypothetical protein
MEAPGTSTAGPGPARRRSPALGRRQHRPRSTSPSRARPGAARAFYGGLLGCPEGRSSAEWIDFDLFGHQIVAHLAPAGDGRPPQRGRRPRRAGAALRRGARLGRVPRLCRAAARRRALRHRALHPLCRPGGRAGDDVLPRPQPATRWSSRPSRTARSCSPSRRAPWPRHDRTALHPPRRDRLEPPAALPGPDRRAAERHRPAPGRAPGGGWRPSRHDLLVSAATCNARARPPRRWPPPGAAAAAADAGLSRAELRRAGRAGRAHHQGAAPRPVARLAGSTAPTSRCPAARACASSTPA